jgi:DNA polymerase/3'-5' exonuclease PolX
MLVVMRGVTMIPKTVRYTATLPYYYVNELKEMAREKKIPSVNFAINKALDEYLKDRKSAQYETSLKEAGKDKAFLTRTMSCAGDFSAVDDEVSGSW